MLGTLLVAAQLAAAAEACPDVVECTRACDAGEVEGCREVARWYWDQGEHEKWRDTLVPWCEADHLGACRDIAVRVAESDAGEEYFRRVYDLVSARCGPDDPMSCVGALAVAQERDWATEAHASAERLFEVLEARCAADEGWACTWREQLRSEAWFWDFDLAFVGVDQPERLHAIAYATDPDATLDWYEHTDRLWLDQCVAGSDRACRTAFTSATRRWVSACPDPALGKRCRKQATSAWRRLCRHGYGLACGMGRDVDDRAQLLAACSVDDADACFRGGLAVAVDDRDRARFALKQACDLGEPRGCYGLYVWWVPAEGEQPPDQLLRRACAEGYPRACVAADEPD